MLGELTDAQIEQVLHSEIVGRIGCCINEKVYVVPVTYVYSAGYIYAHSKEGLKVNMMRQNPNICFQVDAIDNMTNWRSVIARGIYEELKNEKAQLAGMKIMHDRLNPFITSKTVGSEHSISHPPEVVEKKAKAVVYRIKVLEKTGRFEKV